MKLLTTVQTGDLPTGFMQSAEYGNRGANYGWGIGTCVQRTPHEGVAAMLSPGTFGTAAPGVPKPGSNRRGEWLTS